MANNKINPPGHYGREGVVHLLGLSFNINFQPGLEFHSEVVLPDDDSLEPALYQGLVEGFQVCGLLLDEILQLSVCFYKIIWCDRRNLRIFKISHIAGDNVISSDILCTFILQTILEILEGIFFNCINYLYL